jgi:hypothetical protein
MKSIHTLKLGATSIPTAARPTAPEIEPAETAAVELAAPAAAPVSRLKPVIVLFTFASVATLASVAASGTLHSTAVRVASALAALTLAVLIAIEVVVMSALRSGTRAAAPAASGATPRKKFSTSKAILVLMMCAGIAAYFGGAGTFAGFTAETSNPGSNIAAGTLTMNNTVNSGTACLSLNGASSNNVNANCSVALSYDNFEPTNVAAAKITIQNTGSLNASKFYMGSPYVGGKLGAQINQGSNVTSITLSAPGLEGPVSSGDHIQVSYGAGQQVFVASANAAAGATTVSVNSLAATATFGVGGTVYDTDSNTSASNTDCYDTKTTTPGGGVTGATKGTDLSFNPTTGNPFCGTLVFFVQEVGTNHNYCWYGNTSSSPPAGACNAPVSVNLSSGVTTSGATSSLAVNALNGNVKNGDSISIKEGATTVTCTATATAYILATSISVNSCGAGTFTTAALVTDATTLTTLNADVTHTLTNFDTTTKGSSHVELTPVTANGTTAAAATDLPHYDSGVTDTRTFYVGAYFPNPTGGLQNQLQGLLSTFGITWHIDQ